MKENITLVAAPRSERGKNEARRLRVTGKIPAVLYGAGKESAAIALDPKDVNRILYSKSGHNTILNVEVTGQESSPAMIVDWQHDPVKDHLLHIDLERIDLTKRLTVKVPVELQGEPVGVKTQGGMLELVHRDVEVECLPIAIPDRIVVDVSELELGQTIRAQDLPFEEGVELQGKKTMVICHVVEVRVVEEEPEEELEEGVEGEEGEGTEEKKEETEE